MADINQAYGNILDNSSNQRKLSHFFTQRKIDEIHEIVDPKTLQRKKKNISFTQNYLAIVLPKDEISRKLNFEIYGNNGYNFQGEITTYTKESTPNLLIPLGNDKEIFVNIYNKESLTNNKNEDDDDDNPDINYDNKLTKYISFIHVPKRYQSIEDNDADNIDTSSTNMEELVNNKKNLNKTNNKKLSNKVKTGSLQVDF